MGSHSESTNSGARIDVIADRLGARIDGIIRYERQTQLMIGCAGVCLVAWWLRLLL